MDEKRLEKFKEAILVMTESFMRSIVEEVAKEGIELSYSITISDDFDLKKNRKCVIVFEFADMDLANERKEQKGDIVDFLEVLFDEIPNIRDKHVFVSDVVLTEEEAEKVRHAIWRVLDEEGESSPKPRIEEIDMLSRRLQRWIAEAFWKFNLSKVGLDVEKSFDGLSKEQKKAFRHIARRILQHFMGYNYD